MRHTDTTPGWINRRFRALEQQVRELSAAKRLPGSSLTVPNGSITTSSLANPNAPGYVYLTATGFGLTPAGGTLINSSAVVPDGFTSCVVNLTGRVYAYNATTTLDWLYARPIVAGSLGNAIPFTVPSLAAGVNVAPFTTVVTGLRAGDTFTIQLWASSFNAAWTADGGNTADLSGVLLWF